MTPDLRLSQTSPESFRDAEEGESAPVRVDPVGNGLGESGFGEGIAAGSQSGDKYLDGMDLACSAVDERHCQASVVDEEFLAGLVGLAHTRVEGLLELGEVLAELAVSEAVGADGPILFPEQA